MAITCPSRGIAAATCDEIQLKIAETRQEREGAYRLTYYSYLRSGLCEPHPAQMRITPYQLLTTTDTYVAILRGEVICTVSLARDGELGLPMESLYAEEIHQRRGAGLRLAEVTCLADRRSGMDRFFGLFCDLSRLMVQHAASQHVDQLLIAVHPRHSAIYRRYMAFNIIGSERSYSAVRGNPAIPMCLDLNEIQVTRPRNFDQFFGDRIPDEVLDVEPMRLEDQLYFADILHAGANFDGFTEAYCIGEYLEQQACDLPERNCVEVLCA